MANRRRTDARRVRKPTSHEDLTGEPTLFDDPEFHNFRARVEQIITDSGPITFMQIRRQLGSDVNDRWLWCAIDSIGVIARPTIPTTYKMPDVQANWIDGRDYYGKIDSQMVFNTPDRLKGE